MKKYEIILVESWMGDTLWACNVVKNMKDVGYDVFLTHKCIEFCTFDIFIKS